MTSRRFVLIMALWTTVLCGLAGAINFAVDPYDRLGRNRLGIYVSRERDAKPKLARSYPHDALLLGSSMVTFIDPASLSGHRFFNAAFSAALPEEMEEYLRLHGKKARFVMIGLDFFMMNERQFPLAGGTFDNGEADHGITARKVAGRLAYVFSIDVLVNSVRTVTAAALGRPPFVLPNGQRNPQPFLERHRRLTGPRYDDVLRTLRAEHFHRVRYSQARLDSLRSMKALLEAREIPYVAFINPMNQAVWDLLETLPARKDFQRFRRDVREIFPEMVDFSDGGFADPGFYFRQDPYHYLPATGTTLANGIAAPTRGRQQQAEMRCPLCQ
ncbi:MAG: hypothetical protein K2Q10_04675 [Rhodospirillales bacterium]|nr:hypothetical protein [Rhodospirillales bacterium]